MVKLKDISLRPAVCADAPEIIALIQELAESENDHSPVTEDWVASYLANPGSNILLALVKNRVIGMASFSLRPDLYHAAKSCLIELLVVQASLRGVGIGSALIQAVIEEARRIGCAEISVSTGFDNLAARQLYQKVGLTEEALLLEQHFR